MSVRRVILPTEIQKTRKPENQKTRKPEIRKSGKTDGHKNFFC
jgi:hypothetical protein